MASLTPAAHYMGMEINKGEIEEAFPGRSVTLTQPEAMTPAYSQIKKKTSSGAPESYLNFIMAVISYNGTNLLHTYVFVGLVTVYFHELHEKNQKYTNLRFWNTRFIDFLRKIPQR